MPARPPALLREVYLERLEEIRRRAGAAVAHALSGLPLGELSDEQWRQLLLSLYVTWIGTQLASVEALDGYLVGTAATGGWRGRASLVTKAYTGSTIAGTLVWDVLGATRRIVEHRVTGGATQAAAVTASIAWLAAEITSEPHRIARQGVVDAATSPTGPTIGWQRIAEPGACRFCRMLATRGAVYASQATAAQKRDGSRYHPHCRCYAVPVADEVARRRTIKAGREQWRQLLDEGAMPGRTSPHASGASAGPVGDVATRHALQLRQLEASIPALRARVAAGDSAASAPLAWQLGRVEELRRLLADQAA